LCDYVDWILEKRLTAVGLQRGKRPWQTRYRGPRKWIAGGDVQVAPQETEITNYIIGGTKQDVDSQTFAGISL